MTTQELDILALSTAKLVKTAVDEATEPLLARIAALEAREPASGAPGPQGPSGEKGVDGKDGRDGRDGKDGVHGKDGAPGPGGQKGLDGKDGRDGVDGFSLEDFSVGFDGERQLTFAFARGELVKTFTHTVPSMLYRGVYEEGRTYEKGDAVTWGGHLWLAKDATTGKPGVTNEASRAWQMAVKAGRDGREGKAGPTGPQGPRGEKGDAVRFSS